MPKAKPKAKPATVPMPDLWKDDFRSATMRTNFMLTLTQPMIQFLSACADGVMWDRYEFSSLHAPDNWIATEAALTKRGLIRRKPREEISGSRLVDKFAEWTCCTLTPAGSAMVELLKVTGIFVEADAAIRKRTRQG